MQNRLRIRKILEKPKKIGKLVKVAKKVYSESPEIRSWKEAESPENFFVDFSNTGNASRVNKRTILLPTDVIGPYNAYKTRVDMENEQGKPRISKEKTILPIKKETKIDLDEEIEKFREGFKANYYEMLEKPSRSPHAPFKIQAKSLERFKTCQKDWEKLQYTIAEKVQKAPDDLVLNSGKEFILKKKEIDLIDFLSSKNEVNPISYWRTSLREGFYSSKKPNLHMLISVKSAENNPKNTIKYTRTMNLSRNKLRNLEYFQERLEELDRGSGKNWEFVNAQEIGLVGVNKMKMEYETAKKIGAKYVRFNTPEPICEQVIERNYQARVLYS